MLIIHKSPSPVASIGRSASYIASSTRAASSIISIDTAENPRTPPSARVPGSPTIRDPFPNASEISLSPSPRTFIPSFPASPSAFRIHSALCRAVGLATSTRLPGSVHALCTAFTADTVDFPHCRVQFKIPRFAFDRSTSACCLSGSNPSRLANAIMSSSFGDSSPLPALPRRLALQCKRTHDY